MLSTMIMFGIIQGLYIIREDEEEEREKEKLRKERKRKNSFLSIPAVDSGGGTCYISLVYLQQEKLKKRRKIVKKHNFNTRAGKTGQCLCPAPATILEEELP